MNSIHSTLLLLPFATSLAAQSISATVSALAPLPAHIIAGTQSAQATQPAGPLPSPGHIAAHLGYGTFAFASWNTVNLADSTSVLLQHDLEALFATQVNAGAGLHEFLVEFAAVGGPVRGLLTLERDSMRSAGAPHPSIAVDLQNDGIIDVFDLQTFSLPPMVFTAQPLQVRVLMNSLLPLTGYSVTDVKLIVRPDNEVSFVQTAVGCGWGTSFGSALPPQPVFADRGIDLQLIMFGAPSVHVIGLSQQPMLLPQIGTAPCLLVPSPDFVVFQFAPLHIPLPAAVRPLTFHWQGVAISSVGLVTTDGFTVFAN